MARFAGFSHRHVGWVLYEWGRVISLSTMKIIFRVNYQTSTEQSLWLRYSTVLDAVGVRFDHVVPMHWLNAQQWETQVTLCGTGCFRMEYHYQLRQKNGAVLDEWLAPREITVDLAAQDALLLQDTWRSAGTVDYAFETNPFLAMQPQREFFHELGVVPEANHRFTLRMAAVPQGLVPCLIGSVSELGDWGWHSAVPLEETARNVWQKNLYLPVEWHIDYKYGLYDPALNCVVSLELGENRQLPARVAGAVQQTWVSDECYRREAANLFHGAGVAVPVFSLRSEKSLGVGDFADLKPLADWAQGVGLKLIQILPINDTTSAYDWTDSYPYSAVSVFALHPLYLRLDDLKYAMPASFKLELYAERERLNALPEVDYVAVMKVKRRLSRQVFDKNRGWILASAAFKSFVEAQGEWLIPYAVFCVKRDEMGTADFTKWGEWAVYDREQALALADPQHPAWPDVAYHCWLQSELDLQLTEAVAHLHERGLALKGDLPIGIDRQSVEAWSAPHLFKMGAQAGAPPDAFAVKGQNWGFPTYDWEVMKGDGFAWWRSRFGQLSRYFDAYRIDHILGFFRIWQVPIEQVEGIMGYFDPALPIVVDEFRERGIPFDFTRFCQPYLTVEILRAHLGEIDLASLAPYVEQTGENRYQLREVVATQRRIMEHFASRTDADSLKQGLLDCVSEVLFFEVPGSHGTQFHPRCSLQATRSFQALPLDIQAKVDALYVDYFFRRQEDFWQARGLETLPAMRRASSMLLCGEDLGMVPACVPGVLRELGILSLEIQRMPKLAGVEFFDPALAPYLSVVSPSTHDMATLRSWWTEDSEVAARFASQMLGLSKHEPELSPDLAARIIWQHLHSPAMWAIFPLQDLWAMDETLRNPKPEAERINVPAIMPYYWRYRMHVSLETLAAEAGFNEKLARLIQSSGR
jgi:4-alpha-glucanotransferase